MKSLRSAAVFLLLLPALAFPKDKSKQPIVPAVFKNASYVYVEAVDGNEFNPRLLPEDLQAIVDVQNALGDWKRYVLAVKRQDADFVIVVRKGRIAEANAGVIVSQGPGRQGSAPPGPQGNPSPGQPRGQAGPGFGVDAGGEVGPPDDLFEICQLTSDGTLSTPIWLHTLPGGLDKPEVLLFKQFKDAVERAYPSQQAKQAAKP